ncbi:2-deoxy-scyllo-inosose synthase [Durusdinium trenchii]|uniref:2-deoxy-scyllo-inosose synthase n=1 Tax=Durusdinium trenchii TaxID=1381693 RepID=A0ABP0N0D4_9DINO
MSRGLTGGFFKQLEVVEQVERKREAASSIIHHSTAGWYAYWSHVAFILFGDEGQGFRSFGHGEASEAKAMAVYLEEPLYAFWKNQGAGEDGSRDTAETPGMRVDIEKYRMRYRAYRLGYSGAKGALDGLKACEADSSPVDKTTIETAPIDAPLFNHLSDQKQREINKYREDYRKYRLGYASGAKGEVADIFKRQLSRDEKCEAVEEILTRTTSQSSGTSDR